MPYSIGRCLRPGADDTRMTKQTVILRRELQTKPFLAVEYTTQATVLTESRAPIIDKALL